VRDEADTSRSISINFLSPPTPLSRGWREARDGGLFPPSFSPRAGSLRVANDDARLRVPEERYRAADCAD